MQPADFQKWNEQHIFESGKLQLNYSLLRHNTAIQLSARFAEIVSAKCLICQCNQTREKNTRSLSCRHTMIELESNAANTRLKVEHWSEVLRGPADIARARETCRSIHCSTLTVTTSEQGSTSTTWCEKAKGDPMLNTAAGTCACQNLIWLD